jgi:hypothetical protein
MPLFLPKIHNAQKNYPTINKLCPQTLDEMAKSIVDLAFLLLDLAFPLLILAYQQLI